MWSVSKRCSGNDLVTEITVNFAFLCFYSQYFKKNYIYNPLITFLLHPFAFPLKNGCCFFKVPLFLNIVSLILY